MSQIFLATLFSLGSAIIGGGVVALIHNFFISRRATKDRQEELVTNFLIEAFEIVHVVLSNRSEEEMSEKSREIESALSKAYLFGSDELRTKVSAFIDALKASRANPNNKASLDGILKELREDLRHRLNLSEIPDAEPIPWIRIKEPQGQNPPPPQEETKKLTESPEKIPFPTQEQTEKSTTK